MRERRFQGLFLDNTDYQKRTASGRRVGTMNLPENINPIVRVLRDEVPRPAAKIVILQGRPRFTDGRCLMGLHPSAKTLTPTLASSFTGRMSMFTVDDYYNLAFWWDRLDAEQAQKAVDLIWPKED